MTIGKRIQLGRYMSGLNISQLAERAEVSPTAISKYERDMDVPGSKVLLRLARALGVSVEFFLRPRTIPSISPMNYRRRRSLGKKMERTLLARVQDWLERYLEIERIVYGAGAAPTFIYPTAFPRKASSFEDVEKASEDLRKLWGLGIAPIGNLTEILEVKGIKVGVIEADAKFDGLTFRPGDEQNSIAIITRAETPGDRQRFDLACELGRLLLSPDGIDKEVAANRFAGALLAPRQAVLSELTDDKSALDPRVLYALKHTYGLSMGAWIRRAYDAGVISDAKFYSIRKYFGKRGWRKVEPWDQIQPELPRRFEELVMQTMSRGIISTSKATELLGRPVGISLRSSARIPVVVR
ncbi:MAG: ImmA/IrrE family metallo-endopeptidase [Methanotrichaceae archaeon]|nr:ImmA/IrrE family metallo-endopeptidase [Methanotrichaceae archaeon]